MVPAETPARAVTVERTERHSYIRGIAAWLLYDFRSERRQTSFQSGHNRKGLIAEDKQYRKKAFFALRDCFDRIANNGV